MRSPTSFLFFFKSCLKTIPTGRIGHSAIDVKVKWSQPATSFSANCVTRSFYRCVLFYVKSDGRPLTPPFCTQHASSETLMVSFCTLPPPLNLLFSHRLLMPALTTSEALAFTRRRLSITRWEWLFYERVSKAPLSTSDERKKWSSLFPSLHVLTRACVKHSISSVFIGSWHYLAAAEPIKDLEQEGI